MDENVNENMGATEFPSPNTYGDDAPGYRGRFFAFFQKFFGGKKRGRPTSQPPLAGDSQSPAPDYAEDYAGGYGKSQGPLAIALDEELIGVDGPETKRQLLEAISPAYIILKPSLLGGFKASEEWIQLAEEQSIEWWATSALESNIGLSAIAQWVSTKNSKMFQGLGTGLLFSNNIDSPLFVEKGFLHYGESEWKLDLFM